MALPLKPALSAIGCKLFLPAAAAGVDSTLARRRGGAEAVAAFEKLNEVEHVFKHERRVLAVLRKACEIGVDCSSNVSRDEGVCELEGGVSGHAVTRYTVPAIPAGGKFRLEMMAKRGKARPEEISALKAG